MMVRAMLLNTYKKQTVIGFCPQAGGYMADNLAYEIEKSPSVMVAQKIGVIIIYDYKEDTTCTTAANT